MEKVLIFATAYNIIAVCPLEQPRVKLANKSYSQQRRV